MPVTQQDLEQFSRFVQAQLGSAHPPDSLQECLNKWRAEREYEGTIEAIRQSEADIAAGRVMTLEECEARTCLDYPEPTLESLQAKLQVGLDDIAAGRVSELDVEDIIRERRTVTQL